MSVNAPLPEACKFKYQPSQDFPHVYWIDLYRNNMMHECAVTKASPSGTVAFIKLNDLNEIDKQRLARILTNPMHKGKELYEAMQYTTLNNGENALKFFSQMTQLLSPNGTITNASTGVGNF